MALCCCPPCVPIAVTRAWRTHRPRPRHGSLGFRVREGRALGIWGMAFGMDSASIGISFLRLNRCRKDASPIAGNDYTSCTGGMIGVVFLHPVVFGKILELASYVFESLFLSA